MNITQSWPVRIATAVLITSALMAPAASYSAEDTPAPTANFNPPAEETPQSTSLRDLAQWVEHPSDDEEQRAAPSRVGIGTSLEEAEQFL